MVPIQSFSYSAFGLNIFSDLYFPELKVSSEYSNHKRSIQVKKSYLKELWAKVGDYSKMYVVQEGYFLFKAPGVGIFCIQDGNKILYEPSGENDLGQLRLYILGTCMGALLIQRKILPFHGSSFSFNGKAYAIIGESGAGKSTLTSALINKGHRILTDDVIAISSKEYGVPYVYPSYPQQKLWEESLIEFNMDTSNFTALFKRETKYAIPVENHFINNPLPLGGVFELVKSESENVKLTTIDGLERLHIFYLHTYRNFLVQRFGLRKWHLRYTASFAKNIEVYRLTRPTSRFTANELATLIEETVLKEELVHD
ncbi:aldolase [Rossellomorea vietnamensis]|nr:aldolase [Rossellomorea vietnamensis]